MNISHKDLAQKCKDSYKRRTGSIADVEYLITNTPTGSVIAFRGTETKSLISKGGWEDIVRDLRVFPSYDKRVGLAHSGFLKGARAVVDEHLSKFFGRSAQLTITGHSLGGGLAVCAAIMLKSMGYNVQELVTFGCPRAVWVSALGKLDGVKVTQYRHGHDFVTTVPWKMWGYRHMAKNTQLGTRGPRRNWDDHDIDLYIDNLNG
jgi:predicted lipase